MQADTAALSSGVQWCCCVQKSLFLSSPLVLIIFPAPPPQLSSSLGKRAYVIANHFWKQPTDTFSALGLLVNFYINHYLLHKETSLTRSENYTNLFHLVFEDRFSHSLSVELTSCLHELVIELRGSVCPLLLHL